MKWTCMYCKQTADGLHVMPPPGWTSIGGQTVCNLTSCADKEFAAIAARRAGRVAEVIAHELRTRMAKTGESIGRMSHLIAHMILKNGLALLAIACALAGCLASKAAPAHDAPTADTSSDAAPSRDTSPDAYACTPSTAGGCCVFAGMCDPGKDCTYTQDGDPAPSQTDGACVTDGTTPEGGPCAYNNGNGSCAHGLYCAWNNGQIMQTGPYAGDGTCRTMCDPTDATARGCVTGKTCVGMPACGASDHFPDCPSVATANIGYCL